MHIVVWNVVLGLKRAEAQKCHFMGETFPRWQQCGDMFSGLNPAVSVWDLLPSSCVSVCFCVQATAVLDHLPGVMLELVLCDL